MKLRPAPISTSAVIEGSALALFSASMMPSDTPGPSALTGGLLMTIRPISPLFRSERPGSQTLGGFLSLLKRRISRLRDRVHALSRKPSRGRTPIPAR